MTIKKEDSYQGPCYKITVTENTEPVLVFFDHEQSDRTYFEVEVMELSVEVEIGYVQIDHKEKVKLKEEGMGMSGLSLSSTGFVVASGENIYKYGWVLKYGDVIGAGLTRESDKFNERRGWVSKNGVLMNRPPAEEMDKWLATIEISAEEREKFDMNKDKGKTEDEGKDAEVLDKAAEEEKAAAERE